jgi:hypothetical protein
LFWILKVITFTAIIIIMIIPQFRPISPDKDITKYGIFQSFRGRKVMYIYFSRRHYETYLSLVKGRMKILFITLRM